MHKFPCRGQRRRCNASTPKLLNISYKFSTLEMNTNIQNVPRKKGNVRRRNNASRGVNKHVRR